jgi:hypothetical protein
MLRDIKERHRERLQKAKEKFVKLETLKKLKIAYIPYNELFKEGFISGIGWAFGVTVGFVIISSILVIILQMLGGLPLVGSWIAGIVKATQDQLLKRTPIIVQ